MDLISGRAGDDPIAALEANARQLIESGRPDLLPADLTDIDPEHLRGKPWARLGVSAYLVARDPHDKSAARAIRSAERTFVARRDRDGQGYAAYVDGTRYLGIGRHRDAARRWRQVRELLGDDSPVGCNALSHLSVAAYHAGDLDDASAFAEEAVGLARLRLDRRAEGRSLIYRALADLARGDLACSVAAADAADAVFAEVTDPEERFEWPLAPVPRAAAAGFRGDYATAAREADEAIDRSDSVGTEWYRGIALATRAEFCAPMDPNRAIADGRAALELLRGLGDAWWENCALRALGIATRLAGHPRGARRLLERAVATAPSPFERARSELALGHVLAELEEHAPSRTHLMHAISMFRRAGARLVLCQALQALATVSPHQAAALRREAEAAAGGDEAFSLALGSGWPLMASRIEIRCFDPVSIDIDGARATFLTENARRTVLLLALAGEAGLHAEELAEHLWPEAPADRVGQRVRTVLWQARKALGHDAWRIQRRSQIVVMDSASLSIDLIAALEAAESPGPRDLDPDRRSSLIRLLEGPMFGPDRYEPWADEWVERSRAAAADLRRTRTGPPRP